MRIIFVCTTRRLQKEDLSPDYVLHLIKHVNVSIVNYCCFALTVDSTLNVVETLPVGGRLHNFW